MSKAMLINVTHAEEGRVAIVDNGVLDGFEIDTVQRGQIKGNIYKATVRNVNLALQASFVDFGGNLIQISEDADGFLFAATGSIPLSDKFSLYGRLGQSRL